MTAAFNVSSNFTDYLGNISSLNVWDYPLSDDLISSMSYGCGSEKGNIEKRWSNRIKEIIVGKVKFLKMATCRDRGGTKPNDTDMQCVSFYVSASLSVCLSI